MWLHGKGVRVLLGIQHEDDGDARCEAGPEGEVAQPPALKNYTAVLVNNSKGAITHEPLSL